MALTLAISPHGRLLLEDSAEDLAPASASAAEQRIRRAFSVHGAAGLLHLATTELETPLPPSLAFARDLARAYLTLLCHKQGLDGTVEIDPVQAPPEAELASMALQAPPMKGLEYLGPAVLAECWSELDLHVRAEVREHPGGAQVYLKEKNPVWRLVGRVTFHLAENKRDESHPFAFMATYANRLSALGRVQHLPLARALQEYAGARNRALLVALLSPIHRAGEKSALAKELIESGSVYQPMAWTPHEAHRFLKEIPVLEESGLIVRVPDWWKANRPPRPQVSVRIGETARTNLGADALLDFSVGATLGGESLSDAEMREILSTSGGLVRLRGQWVEVDREQLAAALEHWKSVERQARHGGISFFEGMRLLAGADFGKSAASSPPEATREWSGVVPGEWLERTLEDLRNPDGATAAAPVDLLAELRPYQLAGLSWLRFMTRLGLGACLADDMGLGKTIQMLALLLALRVEPSPLEGRRSASLLVVPASLIANWKSEISRFAPSLEVWVAHPSESDADFGNESDVEAACAGRDLVITSYGMLARLGVLRRGAWRLVILDEAQAIKNAGTRQARSVKELRSEGRVALTGTPVENRISDLWSLFDFLNPGLLGGAKEFARFAKSLASVVHNPYGPLRALVRPYILRRLKTDKRVISDLPDKTEVKAFCGLSKHQAALYQQSVRELAEQIEGAEGIGRRGVILAYLMRFKQICNHPSQWVGDGTYDPVQSGKFQRLAELCEELAQRQEKVLVFTQFREITAPLAEFLGGIFGRPGLILHGGTAVAKRRDLVESFQRDDGPPFFVLSLKAGGTGLNLTAACHVIHFDRWWNPAVEDQATDRAFRIGQMHNVLVHKFVCRGTVEEKIDQMIGDKVRLSHDLLEGGGEKMLTEMDNRELLRFVALDIHKAVDA